MTTTSNTESPATLDLDSLIAEVEGKQRFTFTYKGRTWYALDPDDVDWQVILDLDERDTRGVLSAYLGEEQYAEFSQDRLPGSVVTALLNAIEKHYTPQPVGEGDASTP